MVDAGVLHLTDNRSDHSPIFCVISFPDVSMDSSEDVENLQQPKPSWKRADSEEKLKFRALLEDRVSSLIVPESLSSCRDVHCQDPSHIKDLDNFTLDLLETMQDVAEESLPLPGSGGNGNSRSRSDNHSHS